MPKEIYPSSYACDCGHQLHFCENTIREMKEISYRRRAGIGEGDDRHAVVFHKGEMVAIFCPKINAEIPAQREKPEQPPVRKRPVFTRRQGQVLSFIHLYTKLNRQSPAEADIASHFMITPPSAHGIIVSLTKKGLIERQPGQARSIKLRIDPAQLPQLD
jgi:hypothetical protein